MPKTHEGRVAVITGAAQGIGQSIAITLAQRGAKLVLVDLRDCEETTRKIRDNGGADFLALTADISAQEEWDRLASSTDGRFGRADIVINNAGIYPTMSIDDLDLRTWRKTFAVNIDAHFFSAKAFIPLMRRNKWGRFVNVASNSIGYPVPGLSHYMASKMAVIGFVRGLANDVGDEGITVNAILPAPTETPGTAGIPEDMKRALYQMQAIKRMSQAEDLAGPVAFLTSDDAAFITGQALVVDGGAYKIS